MSLHKVPHLKGGEKEEAGAPYRRKICRDFPRRSSGQTSTISLPKSWVQSLVWELRSCKPHSVTKKKKKKRICNSWEVQGKSQCFHKLTTVSSNEAHGSQITDVKGFAIKMLVVIIYTLLLIQKSLLHPSKLLDCLVCLQ